MTLLHVPRRHLELPDLSANSMMTGVLVVLVG